MYLKRIELQGFKSFADKTVLEFKQGITSVIGPNGSGKSNISDAIRWVLGEQSMKSLRSGKSSDVIFAGTQSRKSLGFAEASLVFDNSDGALPIEYEEVVVTRKIYRTGETGYYINKTNCRLKDVLELFMDTGIGKDGYSIIGQGKIDEILSNKSEDRRNVFEEAAGIVKYKTRKEESEKKLEHTKLNLLRINDILSEIESNLEPLKMQSDKARKYLDLKEELKNIEVGLFVYNIEKYKAELVKITEDMEVMNENCNLEEEKLDKIKEEKENLKIRIDEVTSQIEAMQNIGFESEKKKEQLNSNINISKAKIQNNIENEKRFNQEISEYEEKIAKSKEDMQNKLNKKISLAENKAKFQQELDEKEQELEVLNSTLSEKELKIEEDKKKLEENVDKKYEIESEISAKKANILNLEKRLKQIENDISNNIREKDNEVFKKEEIQKGVYEVEKQKNEISNKMKDINQEKIKAEEKIKSIDIQISNYNRDVQFKESRHRFLVETEKEKEGYARGVKALLKDCENIKELGKGMHGALAELIDVPEKYKTAIEMTLGASLQNIVTENEQDAKRLVEHLRENKLGRASFLPITSIKGKKLEKIKGSKLRIVGIASDLIEYDKKYEQIVVSLLGRTVIVEDMDTAIKVAKENGYSFRIVTLEGDLINASGSITGGFVEKKTLNILGRSKEIENLSKEIFKIKKKIQELEEEKENILNKNKDTFEEYKKIESEYQTIDIKYSVEKQKEISVDENIERLARAIQKLRDERAKINEEVKDINEGIKSDEEKIEAIKNSNNELQEVINKFADVNKDSQKRIDDLNYDITSLKISVSSFDESENSINEISDMIKQEIEAYTKNIENKKEQIEKLKEENIKLDQEIEENLKEIEEIKSKVQNSGETVENMKKERVDLNNKLTKKEDEQNDEFKIIEDLKAQIVKIDVRKTKIDDEVNNQINTLWIEYELTPNATAGYARPENVVLTQRRVNNLRTDIRELGSVNVDSIEEYKSLKERYDFMCEQRLDLESTMAKLHKMIAEITNTMKKQFKEKFEIINRNFGEVFCELFGGGKAEITLEDENNILECGININVQPPGKKLQSMTLLSGGEKAFTAIALLFAILKVNPAPFCVLDEIEAALDDVNVNRYADFLKKFAGNTQFLVITHRKGTMEAADTVYGVTMEENGISKLLSMKLK